MRTIRVWKESDYFCLFCVSEKKPEYDAGEILIMGFKGGVYHEFYVQSIMLEDSDEDLIYGCMLVEIDCYRKNGRKKEKVTTFSETRDLDMEQFIGLEI